jgi:acetyl esterase/lipase
MNILRRIFRFSVYFTSLLSLVLGGVHLLRVRSARGLVLRGLKAVSEGLSPFLALAGAASALISLLIHAPLAAIAGSAGAVLNARYVRHVTRPHRAFEDPFGQDWQVRLARELSPDRADSLLRRRWSWRMPRPRVSPNWERDMVYYTVPATDGSPEIPLHCDVWLPPERVAPSGIALLYVHGGGFYTTGKDFGTRAFFRHLVAQGHVAMDINYRLAPNASLLQMVSDVLHAVAWLKENSVLFGAQPEQIVLVGGSAGGNLALLAAYAHDNPAFIPQDLIGKDLSVHAVVSYYGVIDLAAAYHRLQHLVKAMVRRPIPDTLFDRPMMRRALAAAAWVRGVEAQSLRDYVQQNQAVLSIGIESAIANLLGGTPAQAPEMYRLVSPLTHAGPGCPPTLLFHGGHDYLLPSSATRKLHYRLRAAGVPSVYIELPQTEHTFDQFLPEFSPPAQVALYDLERFLALVA